MIRLILIGALVVGVPGAAAAQDPVAQTPAAGPQLGPIESHWLASGFVGSNFGSDAEDASVDFGGSIGYLWRGIAGAEFQANFSPEFELAPARSALLFEDEPMINSYMANVIGAVPIGPEGQFQPYVSGGLGALTLRSDVLSVEGDEDFEPDESRFGGNVGFGVMGFFRGIGLRGDVRYFRGFEEDADITEPDDETDSPDEALAEQVLSELAFWRANVGVAFRW